MPADEADHRTGEEDRGGVLGSRDTTGGFFFCFFLRDLGWSRRGDIAGGGRWNS